MAGGRGLQRGVPLEWPWERLFDAPTWTGDESAAVLAADWYFAGRGALVPVDIPWEWLSGPVRFRQDSPLNAAAVTQSAGVTAYASDATSIDTYGQWGYTSSTAMVTAQDAQALADWVVAYYTDPRVRCPRLLFNLRSRTDTECWTLLRREVGDVIRIVDPPTGWPEGANVLVIEGVGHASNQDTRFVAFAAAPLIGVAPDAAGPWFRVGVSQLDGSDVLPA